MKTYLDIYLDIRYSETNQEVHENDADEDDEEEDHEVSGERKYRLSVLVDEILVLDFPRHHDQSLKCSMRLSKSYLLGICGT